MSPHSVTEEIDRGSEWSSFFSPSLPPSAASDAFVLARREMLVGLLLLPFTVVSSLPTRHAPLAALATPRASRPVLRIKNSASPEASDWNKNPSLKPPRKTIAPDQPDLGSPQQTFEALCRMCGVTTGRDAALDFDGFVLAFEQVRVQPSCRHTGLRSACLPVADLQPRSAARPGAAGRAARGRRLGG